MDHTQIDDGMQVKIKLPQELPSWMTDTWRRFVRASGNGKLVTIASYPRTGKDWALPASMPQTDYFVSLKDFTWLFMVDWLELSGVTGVKIPCNCPMATIMAAGCKNKDHT